MHKKDSIIDKSLLEDITAYCELNKEDTIKLINSLLKSAFLGLKYAEVMPDKEKVDKVSTEEIVDDEKPSEVKDDVKQKEPERRFFGSKNNNIYGE